MFGKMGKDLKLGYMKPKWTQQALQPRACNGPFQIRDEEANCIYKPTCCNVQQPAAKAKMVQFIQQKTNAFLSV